MCEIPLQPHIRWITTLLPFSLFLRFVLFHCPLFSSLDICVCMCHMIHTTAQWYYPKIVLPATTYTHIAVFCPRALLYILLSASDLLQFRYCMPVRTVQWLLPNFLFLILYLCFFVCACAVCFGCLPFSPCPNSPHPPSLIYSLSGISMSVAAHNSFGRLSNMAWSRAHVTRPNSKRQTGCVCFAGVLFGCIFSTCRFGEERTTRCACESGTTIWCCFVLTMATKRITIDSNTLHNNSHMPDMSIYAIRDLV